jgi:hypothetical protein
MLSISSQLGYVGIGEEFLGINTTVCCSSMLAVLGILVLANAHGGAVQSARIVVRYALCPLATPAQIERDGGDNAVAGN